MAKKRRGMKVGSSKITTRKIRGKRRKVRVTKVTSCRYKVQVMGSRRKAKRRSRRGRRR